MNATTDPRGNINEWTSSDVCLFFNNLGFPQYEEAILDNDLTGDLLLAMDANAFKDLGLSVGQRLAVLKAVYLVKLAHDIPLGPDDYVPPSEAAEKLDEASVEKTSDGVTVDTLHDLLKAHAQRLLQVEEENRVLRTTLHSALEDMNRRIMQGEESPLSRSKSFKWSDFMKPTRSPTKPETFDSPQSSPRRAETDNSRSSTRTTTTMSEVPSSRVSAATTAVESSVSHPKPTRQDSMDNLKSFKVSLEDPAWKVLPAALKKYKINNDDWQNYAMFICYGSAGNRVERCLSYDEKPLLLFQKLKDAKKNPVFMLKHIKDIRSPIAVAQQKHAARKASSGENVTSPPISTASTGNVTRLPHLHVTPDVLGNTGPMTGSALQTGWPELMSPAVENKGDGHADTLLAADGALKTRNGSPGNDGEQLRTAPSGRGAAPREMPPMQGISYAVAIYPYMAEQEDEFDVVVGDAFIILSRARGWWVVQRDEVGSGQVDVDASKQGWVPAGCLLETKVPVASAIAEASAASGITGVSSPVVTSPVDASRQQKKRPILPLSIVSTSFPGVALMEYQGKGEEELDLIKDEPLRVFKRYNHWSYAVKEDGERGWVPSWYIGKTSAEVRQAPPPSPGATAGLSSFTTSTMDDSISAPGISQPSPMSSAFPVAGTRATVVS